MRLPPAETLTVVAGAPGIGVTGQLVAWAAEASASGRAVRFLPLEPVDLALRLSRLPGVPQGPAQGLIRSLGPAVLSAHDITRALQTLGGERCEVLFLDPIDRLIPLRPGGRAAALARIKAQAVGGGFALVCGARLRCEPIRPPRMPLATAPWGARWWLPLADAAGVLWREPVPGAPGPHLCVVRGEL